MTIDGCNGNILSIIVLPAVPLLLVLASFDLFLSLLSSVITAAAAVDSSDNDDIDLRGGNDDDDDDDDDVFFVVVVGAHISSTQMLFYLYLSLLVVPAFSSVAILDLLLNFRSS